jgi:hypothetical protein
MENMSSRIADTIETGSVYYFQDDSLSSDEPHYFLVLNKNPRTEEFLMLVCASSKVEKRKRIAKRLGFPKKTMVVVSPLQYATFKVESVIDCNRIFEKSIKALSDRLDRGRLKICKELMPKAVIQELITGALASNQVSEKVRKILLDI